MIRFFDIVQKNHILRPNKLNLADSGIGDHSIKIICKIIKNNTQFS